jgi:hypothetical protein
MARQVACPSSITSSLVSCVIPADQHPEQQDQRSPDSQVQGHGLVGEALVKLPDMGILSQQECRLLARRERHRQLAGQAAAACPLEEVAHGPAGGGAARFQLQPLVEPQPSQT